MNKIILIGGDHYNGLSLVRLFGKNGLNPYGIIVCPSASDSFLRKSRYWEKVWTVPEDDQIIEILNTCFPNENEKPVIIPWSDGAASLLDNHLDALKERFILPSVNGRQGCIYELMDKGRQVSFAHDCGMQIAESYEILLDRDYSIEGVRIPCICKPIVSCEGNKKDIRKIDTIDELKKYLEELRSRGYRRILLQEYVSIEKEYDIEGFIHNDSFSFFCSEKVRTWPNIGGPTAFSFSVDNVSLNNEVLKIIEHLKEMRYSGLFDVEIFKVGDRYLFNEINWRNSAVCFAAVASGVFYPLYWYEAVTGRKPLIYRSKTNGAYAMVELLDYQHVKAKEISMQDWLRDFWKSKAKAYLDIGDLSPLIKRVGLFLKRRGL